MKKRGKIFKNRLAQISVFVIIALVVVGAIALIITLKNKPLKDSEPTDSQAIPVYNFVKGCLDKTSKDAVNYIGATGGYFSTNRLTTDNNIAYYYDNGKNNFPEKEKIETELSKYVESMLFLCTKDYYDFSNTSSKINAGTPNVTTRIIKNKVIFSIIYPVTISTNGKSYSYENFGDVTVPSRLFDISAFSKNIIDDMVTYKGSICLSCILSDATNNRFYVEMNDYDNDTTIFTVIDKDVKLNSENYAFYFATRP